MFDFIDVADLCQAMCICKAEWFFLPLYVSFPPLCVLLCVGVCVWVRGVGCVCSVAVDAHLVFLFCVSWFLFSPSLCFFPLCVCLSVCVCVCVCACVCVCL